MSSGPLWLEIEGAILAHGHRAGAPKSKPNVNGRTTQGIEKLRYSATEHCLATVVVYTVQDGGWRGRTDRLQVDQW
jgi:hypothetical protein